MTATLILIEVNPSVVCGDPCDFHEFITLEGWSNE